MRYFIIGLLFYLSCLLSLSVAHRHHSSHSHKKNHGHDQSSSLNDDSVSLYKADSSLFHHPSHPVSDYHPRRLANIPTEFTYYSWHIHVYFFQNNINSSSFALSLQKEFIQKFSVSPCEGECGLLCNQICHWEFNQRPIGPHPVGSWGIYVPNDLLTPALNFINPRRGDLTILVHPNSGYPVLDHSDHSMWIGQRISIDLSALQESLPTPAPEL